MKQSLILLHGLFGNLSNWTSVVAHFDSKYDVHVPLLPILDEHKEDELDYLVNWLSNYIDARGLKNVVLVGNSLGGHVAILYADHNPTNVRAVLLAGSSGLYENSTLGTYPRRHDYAYIHERVAYTFYDPAIASKELVDEVFETVGDNRKCLRIVKTSKKTQRSYVTDLLPQMELPVLLIWGRQDQITPPSVAEEFHQMLPNSKLIYFEACGHVPMMEHPKEFNRLLEEFLNENAFVAANGIIEA